MRDLTQKEGRKLLKGALERKTFPIPMIYSESTTKLASQERFIPPVFIWVPEVKYGHPGGKPYCADRDCNCIPDIQSYERRIVHDADHVTFLLFVRYTCKHPRQDEESGKVKSFTFSTISKEFFNSNARDLEVSFPYILTHRSGIANSLMVSFHDAVMEPNGLQPQLRRLFKSRTDRYMLLKCKFHELQEGEGKSAHAMEIYMTFHSLPHRNRIHDLWMAYSEPYEQTALAIMDDVYAERCYRMDGTMKIGKKAFVVNSKPQVKPKNGKVLLLAVNEISQWIFFSFRTEEDKTAIATALKECREAQIKKNPWVPMDNANAYRETIAEHFPNDSIRQDPWHVIRRFAKYAKVGYNGKVCETVKESLYDDKGYLRPVKEMKKLLKSNVQKPWKDGAFKTSDEAALEGTLHANLLQIEKKDLSEFLPVQHINDFVCDDKDLVFSSSIMESNALDTSTNSDEQDTVDDIELIDDDEDDVGEYPTIEYDRVHEEGGHTVRVVSTSQVEGENSRINALVRRRVKFPVLVRILLIHSITVFIRQGVKFKRIPANIQDCNLISLFQTALLCRTTVPAPEDAWALRIARQMIQKKSLKESNVLMNDDDALREADRFFCCQTLEAKHIPKKKNHRLQQGQRHDVLNLLRSSNMNAPRVYTVEYGYTSVFGLSTERLNDKERFILYRLRIFQAARGKLLGWGTCVVVSTLLYNRVIDSHDGCTKKSYMIIAAASKKQTDNFHLPRIPVKDPFEF